MPLFSRYFISIVWDDDQSDWFVKK